MLLRLRNYLKRIQTQQLYVVLLAHSPTLQQKRCNYVFFRLRAYLNCTKTHNYMFLFACAVISFAKSHSNDMLFRLCRDPNCKHKRSNYMLLGLWSYLNCTKTQQLGVFVAHAVTSIAK